jgi:hypothetical protein
MVFWYFPGTTRRRPIEKPKMKAHYSVIPASAICKIIGRRGGFQRSPGSKLDQNPLKTVRPVTIISASRGIMKKNTGMDLCKVSKFKVSNEHTQAYVFASSINGASI